MATSASPPKYESVGLVLGATGIVGNSLVELLPLPGTPGGPWKVYAVARRPRPAWSLPDQHCSSVHHLQCDLSDPDDCRSKLSPLSDLTHVFYVAVTASDDGEGNVRLLRNALSAVVPHCPGLRHICLQTGRMHYFDPLDQLLGNNAAGAPELPFHESLPRQLARRPNFYYEQEDVLLDAVRRSEGRLTWSVHRPGVIFGLSPHSRFNIIVTLCAYAAICRREGAPLRFPGSRAAWEAYSDASDADLVAEQQVWAGTDPRGRNEAFNCSNGDVFRWRALWGVLAEQYGVEAVGYRGEEGRFRLEDAVRGKEEAWRAIVREEGLLPTRLEEVGDWRLVDGFFSVELYLDSMNKSKKLGFLGFRDSVASFVGWIGKARSRHIVP